MKGYCQWCGCEIDEVEYMQFDGAHYECKKVRIDVKYPKLKIKKGNEVFHYVCQSATWNFYLNRFYPIAELIMTTEILNHN